MGFGIATTLLAEKMVGQARLVGNVLGRDDLAGTIASMASELGTLPTVEAARQAEATAASLYFGAWEHHPATTLRFRPSDRSRVPAHWPYFEGRRSLLTGGTSNRKAERPLNAIISYLGALAAVETRLAALAVGLDPGMGIVHTDMKGRDSLVLDLLEALRPDVESYALRLVAERTWRRADFHEAPDGSVMLGLELRHHLAGTLPTWARAAAPVAERVCHTLGQAMARHFKAVTPLSGKHLREAQALVKARRLRGRKVELGPASPR